MRTPALAALLLAALAAPAAAEDGKKAEKAPVPERFGFSTANTIDGKFGAGTWYATSNPLGASTGYLTLFGQLDWDGIMETPWSFHVDMDARVGLLYEPLDPTVFGRDGQPEGVDNALGTEVNRFYRRPRTFLSGRSYDYLRIDTLYGAYETDDFGVRLGRSFVRPAASNQVDGVDGYFKIGRSGRVGAFVGIKPNPWHQQVVGAGSGGYVLINGQYQRPFWHLLEDPDPNNAGNPVGDVDATTIEGAGSNDLFVTSTRFFTGGAYGTVRMADFFFDGAVVADLFDYNIDRLWGYSNAGWRMSRSATLNFRGTLDVIGARPLQPRDIVLDFTWRDLGPARVSASYTKINTFATALSYGVFFRPLENGIRPNINQPTIPVVGNPDFDPFFNQAAGASDAALFPLNNDELFLVDRDKLAVDVAVQLGEGNTLESYATGFIERRGDVAYTFNAPLDPSGLINGLSNTFAGLCSFEDAGPVGTNLSVPVHEDLCRLGGTLGLRDPFLGGVGSFDVHYTHINGFFSQTNAIGGHVGVGLADVAWFEVGGGMETTDNQRLYSAYNPNPAGGQAQFLAARTNAYLLDASASWNIWNGIILEGSYFGFIEDVPFIGDTRPGGGGPELPRDTTQTTHSLFARALWRF